MKYSDFEKELYKSLFEQFSKGEYHAEFLRDEYDGDFEQLRSALRHLDEGGILFLFDDKPNELYAELTPEYCFSLEEI